MFYKFKVGEQVANIPFHAYGDINHEDVQFGFITELKENGAFVRYWTKRNNRELRTKANSEFTYFDYLVPHYLHDQNFIVRVMQELDYV